MATMTTKDDLYDLFQVFARKCGVSTNILVNGKLNVGSWKLDFTEGGAQIMVVSDSAGTLTPRFSCGPLSKSELFDRMVFAMEYHQLANPLTVKKRQ